MLEVDIHIKQILTEKLKELEKHFVADVIFFYQQR
jgi:hypothetical protein